MRRNETKGSRVRLGVVALAAALATPFHAAAQLAGQDAAAVQALAAALLRVEFALKERPPAPGTVADVSRTFDRATLAFFTGQLDAVVSTLDALVASVEPDPEAQARHRARAEETLAGLDAKRRTLDGSRPPVPYRLHVPPGTASAPLPVVVALHGAGGNEHMFLEAYGAGRIRELADERGFVVVSPSTMALVRAPETLWTLLDAVGGEHAIDRTRVYLLGHSMGAGAAWTLAERFPELVAGVACIAGNCGASWIPGAGTPAEHPEGAPPFPPLLAIAGELDPIVTPAVVEGAVEQARGRGVDVEYRLVADQGHTLVVGAVLDEVVAWLLSRPPTGG